jgi:hypothetical protein
VSKLCNSTKISTCRVYNTIMQILRMGTAASFTLVLGFLSLLMSMPQEVEAVTNITSYSDTLSDSGPGEPANHTLSFKLGVDVSPGSVLEVTPPSGFEVTDATTTFSERNIELLVDGVSRASGAGPASPGVDAVEITRGSPGFIRYTLAPDSGISAGSRVVMKIGNHTNTALGVHSVYSSTTGTTTLPADIEPIQNSTTTLGVHKVRLEIFDGSLVAETDFVVFLNKKVNLPSADTTETVPPERFNPAPTSTVGGTTLSVEISLETNEFSVCKFDLAPGTAFNAMPYTFANSGKVFHSQVVAIVAGSLQQFFVRCIDDEGNFNIDDFVIEFTVNERPTGSANEEGDVDGDGTGTGNDGTGDGDGSGGTTGQSSGEQPLEGGSAGTGGSGGGGGGGSGGDRGSTAGGGFESTDAPYESGDGRVIISGYAYPNSTVGILVDGNFFDTTSVGRAGDYSITLDEIARGVYTFGVYAVDQNDVRSSTFSTSFTVTGARTSELSNINIAPTIVVAPDPVDPGQTLTVSGYGLPEADIMIENGPINATASGEFSTFSDSAGLWTTTIPTNGFSVGTYQIRAKSDQNVVGGSETNFSDYTFYGVGESAQLPINADLNRDGKVNLIDFSILLFWWNSDGGNSEPPADINSDGTVSLTDFSILLFNWTG